MPRRDKPTIPVTPAVPEPLPCSGCGLLELLSQRLQAMQDRAEQAEAMLNVLLQEETAGNSAQAAN